MFDSANYRGISLSSILFGKLFDSVVLDRFHDQLCLDLGVDPNKSTPVDLGIRSRVGSILLGAVDPPSNLK